MPRLKTSVKKEIEQVKHELSKRPAPDPDKPVFNVVAAKHPKPYVRIAARAAIIISAFILVTLAALYLALY